MTDLQDKVAVITGGSVGAGRAAAAALAPEGAKVAVPARGQERPRSTVQEHIGWYRRVAAVVVLTLAAAVGGALATLCQGREKGQWGELGKTHGGRRDR
jgi:NAD(P)-dependent dehydrogenase (short-subunit alcohol dehydrogenase family)